MTKVAHQEWVDDPHDPILLEWARNPPFLKTTRVLDLVRSGLVFSSPDLSEHQKKLFDFLSLIATGWHDVGDAWVSLGAMHFLISQTYRTGAAEEMFRFMGSPAYAIGQVDSARVALFKRSGLDKAKFARRAAAERGTSEKSERQALDRSLKKVERRERAEARARNLLAPKAT